jgi:hypothetical protein
LNISNQGGTNKERPMPDDRAQALHIIGSISGARDPSTQILHPHLIKSDEEKGEKHRDAQNLPANPNGHEASMPILSGL